LIKVLLVSESYGASLFGVAKVICDINKYCSRKVKVKVLATRKDDSAVSHYSEIPIYSIGKSRNSFGRLMRWHHGIGNYFTREIREFGPHVTHVHGVFTFIQAAAIRASIKGNIPIIISSHGMLEPWLWRQKGEIYYWAKRILWNILYKPAIKKVNFIHAITDQEARNLAKEFPNIPQIKIPNAIEISEYSAIQEEPEKERYLFFIGRLHPKKGVDLLISAFAKVREENIRMIIAGPDFDADYTAKLKAQVESLGLSERVSFVGSVHGEKKSELLEKAWCTVIPSYSDVVALVNLESAASFTPTITTTMTGLSDWQEGGGLLVEPELEALTDAMITACEWSLDERMQMGKRARAFVEQRYSWDVIGEQWVEAYKMIAASGKKRHG